MRHALAPEREKAMAAPRLFTNGNQLLQAMSSDDFAVLAPSLQHVDMPIHRDMEKPNRPIEAVFFMDTGIASVVGIQPNGTAVEIGLIGGEGMSGTAIVLGTDRSPHSTYIQVSGTGQKLGAEELRNAMRERPSMQTVLLKFAQAFAVQTGQTAIANGRAKLHERLARWLLMAHDRVSGNTLPLTHEFLSLMLAVRRAGVTEAMHVLQSQELIQAHRGEMIILNRNGLEKIAGNFYGVPELEYRRLFAA
jgi:CRP-like cAMP-binding protein